MITADCDLLGGDSHVYTITGSMQLWPKLTPLCHTAGKKKGSMFSVPEGVNAKVGVIGSGQAPTDYKPKSRHDFVATDDAE